ncbi:MAG TPA: hypothetical protein PLL30_00745 [Candidatus Krumholzibacteria bacterium]|nr:hypothetical protein [Candidatus Krumholzibacteria bacterium]HPD70288.1 hypothetical protein [Candidatus Krumholzibacteria bacterium]HRY40012.1 hypothetical protein [Candidatus Krumholzibacteria bacterium]
MDPETRLADAIEGRSQRRPDGKLALRCEDAFALAKEYSVPLETIGRLCNENGVRIAACQLGCFA